MILHPTLLALMPELVLSIGAVVVLFAGTAENGRRRNFAPAMSLLTIAGALYATALLNLQREAPAADSLRLDALTLYVRMLVGVVGGLIVLANWHVPRDGERAEFFALLLFSFAGISLVAAADDLLLLFLGLELVSVPTYILIGLSRDEVEVQEATVKYFFLGAFAAALTLYGVSFLYGAAGATAMTTPAAGSTATVAAALARLSPADGLVRIGLLLTLAGLAFKIAAVPLHFYVPDVYQGAASPVSGMLGFVPKLAGFVALMRVFDMMGWLFDWPTFWMLWVVAAATMTAGNTLALMQRDNVKRVLAYSSVAHSGYMLIALLAGPGPMVLGGESPLRNGLAAIMFYIAIYGVMNLGAFAALAYFRTPSGKPVETFDELSAAARSNGGWPALALAVCAVGLMGLPPTAGVIGKMFLFSSALSIPADDRIHGPMLWLVLLGVANAAIAAAYYLRIASACLIGERPSGERPERPAAGPTPCHALRVGLGLCAVAALYLFVRPGPLMRQATRAVETLQLRPPPVAADHAGQTASLP